MELPQTYIDQDRTNNWQFHMEIELCRAEFDREYRNLVPYHSAAGRVCVSRFSATTKQS